MSLTTQKITRCGGIIFNKQLDSVLIVLNKNSYFNGENKWGFPKGHRNPKERILDCAKREIKEETGILLPKLMFKRKIYIHNTIYYIIFLKQDYLDFKFDDKKEIFKVNWITLQDLKNLNYNRDIKKFLEKNKNLNNFDFCEKKKLIYNNDNNIENKKENKYIICNNQVILV